MVVKVNVSLPEKVLKDLDEAAHQAGASRSALLTQAVQLFLETKDAEKRAEQRRRAAADIDRIREQYGGGDWDGTAEVLKWRDLH